MNNTINQSRMNNSRPSFNGLSQKAQRYITEESLTKLVEARKIKLGDFEYLKNHKLEIDVLQGDSRVGPDGRGLHIRSPYSNQVVNYDEANYLNSPVDIKLTPIEYKFIKTEFENIGQTLGSALKKAVKFFKKFDKVELEKENYYKQNGKDIDALSKQRKQAYEDYKELFDRVMSNERSASRYYENNDPYAPVAKLDKKLSRFHNDEYFEKKQKKLFSRWNS